MIVTCERCETEFQLDDARVPEGGARVRCSRCKHAFFVLPPAAAASPEPKIDRAVSAAVAEDPVPDVTADLPESSPEQDERESHESDWEFNRDLPARGDSSPDLAVSSAERALEPDRDPLAEEEPEPNVELAAEPEARPARAAARLAEPAPEAADLGSPVDWDFLDSAGERAVPAAAAPPRPAGVLAIDVSAESASESAPRPEIPPVLRIAATRAGWIATAGLCAVALLRGLAPAVPAATAWPDPAPGVALEQVRGRWLDNVSLGRLYVVSGRVHNVADTATALPPLVLELRDPSGRAVGNPIPLRGTSSPALLRAADPGALATAGSDSPGGLAAGVTWDFEAVAWPLPAQAARFAIRAGS